MPVDEPILGFLSAISTSFVVKVFLILFLIFYVVFAFVLYRQIQLMCKTLPTPAVPFLKFLAIVHIGVSVALLFAVTGTF